MTFARWRSTRPDGPALPPLPLREPARRSLKGSPTNLVTEMDRGAEAIIVEALRARFPDHAILAEERGALPGAPAHRWIIDPLDGTTNYAHGLPIYGVSIGLEDRGPACVLGVVYDPSQRGVLRGRARARRLLQRHVRLAVSSAATLDAEPAGHRLSLRHPRGADNNLDRVPRAFILRARSVRRHGLGGARPGRVAAGRSTATGSCGSGAWDVAAGALLIERRAAPHLADGGPLDLDAPAVAASNGAHPVRDHPALKEVGLPDERAPFPAGTRADDSVEIARPGPTSSTSPRPWSTSGPRTTRSGSAPTRRR